MAFLDGVPVERQWIQCLTTFVGRGHDSHDATDKLPVRAQQIMVSVEGHRFLQVRQQVRSSGQGKTIAARFSVVVACDVAMIGEGQTS
jgi:hypothetical protein